MYIILHIMCMSGACRGLKSQLRWNWNYKWLEASMWVLGFKPRSLWKTILLNHTSLQSLKWYFQMKAASFLKKEYVYT